MSYEGFASAIKKSFCSAKCQSAARRASGVDNEIRTCQVCDAPFTINKHYRTKSCGGKCGRKLSVISKQKAKQKALENTVKEGLI
jgi:hypothetical protein